MPTFVKKVQDTYKKFNFNLYIIKIQQMDKTILIKSFTSLFSTYT